MAKDFAVTQVMGEETYHPIEDKVVHIVDLFCDGGRMSVPIRLHSLLSRLSMGQTLPDIKRDIPDIPMRSLIHARAYFAACYPELYKPHYQSGLKVLIDENIDRNFTTDAARLAFGESTHIDFIDRDKVKKHPNDYGAQSVMDIELWKYACANQFNMIVTKDRANVCGRDHLDLTRCALMAWKWKLQAGSGHLSDTIRDLPRVLHVMDANVDSRDLSSTLLEHKDSIIEIFEECSSPIIEMNRRSVKPGISFLEILAGGENPKLEKAISFHVERIIKNFDIDHFPCDRQKRIKESLRSRVKHDMADDFAKIPFNGKRAEIIDKFLAERIKLEEDILASKKNDKNSTYREWYRKTMQCAA